MKLTRTQLNKQLSWIMRYAHKLRRDGVETLSEALKLSWKICRSQIFIRHMAYQNINQMLTISQG